MSRDLVQDKCDCKKSGWWDHTSEIIKIIGAIGGVLAACITAYHGTKLDEVQKQGAETQIKVDEHGKQLDVVEKKQDAAVIDRNTIKELLPKQ